MKKITTYESGEIEDVIFVTADGRGFRIFDLGSEREQVYEGVSVTDASPQEEAAIQKYLADPASQTARLRNLEHDDTVEEQERIAFQVAVDEARQAPATETPVTDLPFLPPWAQS